MKVIFAMTMGISMLLFVILIGKIREHLTHVFISLLLLFFSLGSAFLVFGNSYLLHNLVVSTVINASPVAFGSLTYLYIYYNINNEKLFQSRHALLFIPFTLALYLSFIELTQNNYGVSILLNLGLKISWNLGVLVFSLILLKNAGLKVSKDLATTMKWLNQFVYIEFSVFLFYLSVFVLWIVDFKHIENVMLYSNLSGSLFIFPISYLSIQNNVLQKTKVSNTQHAIVSVSPTFKFENTDKCQPNKELIHDEKVEIYYTELECMMREKQVYLDENMNLEIIASSLNIHSRYLSYVIHTKTNKSFNDYINSYRIEHFIGLIEKKEHKKRTLLSLAYESGFASKSSFNRVFKSCTGYSPSDYIKNKI